MADRRCLSKTLLDSDHFLDMPLSAQALYMHLAIRADDDGFIDNPKSIQRMVGAKEDDMKLLVSKEYIIVFDTGVIVITHWKVHNSIRKDMYKETQHKDEKCILAEDDNGAYYRPIYLKKVAE